MKDGKRQVDGTIQFDGELPMTWVPVKDARWKEICRFSNAANKKNRHYPMTSAYVPGGLGSFFRTEYVAAVGPARAK